MSVESPQITYIVHIRSGRLWLYLFTFFVDGDNFILEPYTFDGPTPHRDA
jgi:hypothetical protein